MCVRSRNHDIHRIPLACELHPVRHTWDLAQGPDPSLSVVLLHVAYSLVLVGRLVPLQAPIAEGLSFGCLIASADAARNMVTERGATAVAHHQDIRLTHIAQPLRAVDVVASRLSRQIVLAEAADSEVAPAAAKCDVTLRAHFALV